VSQQTYEVETLIQIGLRSLREQTKTKEYGYNISRDNEGIFKKKNYSKYSRNRTAVTNQ
jgi:hypothetical protein